MGTYNHHRHHHHHIPNAKWDTDRINFILSKSRYIEQEGLQALQFCFILLGRNKLCNFSARVVYVVVFLDGMFYIRLNWV